MYQFQGRRGSNDTVFDPLDPTLSNWSVNTAVAYSMNPVAAANPEHGKQLSLKVGDYYSFEIWPKATGAASTNQQARIFSYNSFGDIRGGLYEVILRNTYTGYATHPDDEHLRQLLAIPFSKHLAGQFSHTKSRINQKLKDYKGPPGAKIVGGSVEVKSFAPTLTDRLTNQRSPHQFMFQLYFFDDGR